MANLYDLLNHINFTSDDMDEIDGALGNLIDTIISKANDGKIAQPISIFKFGSIARKTKIKPLDDVDIIYVVGTADKQPLNDTHIITKCSLDFGPEKYNPENNISSLIFLNDIKSAIEEAYPRSEVRRNQEVVNVYLSSYEVGFDVVPAFYISNMNYHLIPIGGGGHNWKKTNPSAGEQFFNRVNEKHSGQVRNAIKIIKYWFQKKKIVTPRSYHLECVLCYAFEVATHVQSELINALNFSFTHINYNNYLNSCPDPTGLTGDINSNLTTEQINKIIEEANVAKELLKDIPEFVKYIDKDIE